MSKRTQQIGEEMLRILSETIQYEMSDPRVGFATVVNVEVSGDLQHARVYVSVMGDEEQQRETMAALEHARGFLRRQVAQELNHLRTVPDLSFKLDTSLAYSQRIGELLRQVEEERGQGNQPDSEGAPRDEEQRPSPRGMVSKRLLSVRRSLI